MILTTSSKDERLIEKAVRLSETYGIPYRIRGEKSLAYLFETEDTQVFVVNHRRGLSYYEPGKAEAFYHPNMAFQRLKILKNGGTDCLTTVCGLERGMTFLDGTLGLAADARIAAHVVGESGRVIGVEKSLPLSILVREGLAFHAESDPELKEILGRMELHPGDNLEFLKTRPADSADIVYFDFMFHRPVSASFGIETIRGYAVYDVLTDGHIAEAARVARERVIVKTDLHGCRALLEKGFVCRKQTSRNVFYMGRELKE